MAFPPRPRSSRAEPSLSSAAPAAREAVPLRAAATPRPATRPATGDVPAERETLRFPAEQRRGSELPSLSLSAADRLVTSSSGPAGARREQGGGFLRVLGFAVLLALAAFGAYTLYHAISGFLPWG